MISKFNFKGQYYCFRKNAHFSYSPVPEMGGVREN